MKESSKKVATGPLEKTNYSGRNVRLCTDGKYRWTYPMNMLTNPSIYITVCKIFGVLGVIAFVTSYIGPVFRGEFSVIVDDLKWWGVAVLVFLAISALAYLIVAAQYGWKYIVMFTMDEKGILHEQVPSQKKIARRMGKAVGGAGFLTGSPGRAGQGLLIAGHTSLSSDFSKVRSVKAQRRWHTIKVNEPFAKNQIYTSAEDFDFVLDFIIHHCPKVKEK